MLEKMSDAQRLAERQILEQTGMGVEWLINN